MPVRLEPEEREDRAEPDRRAGQQKESEDGPPGLGDGKISSCPDVCPKPLTDAHGPVIIALDWSVFSRRTRRTQRSRSCDRSPSGWLRIGARWARRRFVR